MLDSRGFSLQLAVFKGVSSQYNARRALKKKKPHYSAHLPGESSTIRPILEDIETFGEAFFKSFSAGGRRVLFLKQGSF
ncbi:hypothetical protein [Palaeococcus ferrophilus]|uniref:hypothetical protein n=1 Tax=Palaeococcus ferrophilus TaxID=83868 RepID=UPI0014774447|nr:hypothetical protein [Palaeococcus ferrophilus]